MPTALRDEIKKAALYNGRSINEEIVARLEAAAVADQFDRLARDNAEIKAMLRELLDKS